MKAPCERYDQTILMLVHGALDRREALFVRLHLVLCPACRQRRRRLEDVTRSLATALANPRLGVRRLTRNRTVWASVGLLVVVFAGLGLLVSSEVSAASAAPAMTSTPVAFSHCGHCHDEAASDRTMLPPSIDRSVATKKRDTCRVSAASISR